MKDAPHPGPGQPPQDSLDAAALQPGARIHEYRILRVLGVGGFGITYLAQDVHLDLEVAIKEYFPSELAVRSPDGHVQPRSRAEPAVVRFHAGLRRFVEEARALATFRHPNIVRVLRYFEAQGTACIVMEYETGQPLRRWMQGRLPLTQQTLLSIVLPLLDGLDAVHEAGFLHRDIKPDNIFVRTNGSPVLLDFGAARRVCAGGALTNIVSPGFAPFEQYHSRGRQGPWTDIYSIGAVMYWMATGQKPLDAAARTKSDTLEASADLADPDNFEPALLRAIDWALVLEERRRPQSVSELRAVIARTGGSFALPPPPPSDMQLPLLPTPEPAELVAAAAQASLPQVAAVPSYPASGPAPQGYQTRTVIASAPSPLPAAEAAPTAFVIAAASRRNVACTILFIDLVGYSTLAVDQQVSAKQAVNRLVAQAVQAIPPDSRLAIDTGDGAAICFIADPEQTLDAALVLHQLLREHARPRLRARMGLHLGPVRVVADINNRVNVVGDGINVAQRVMDFAEGSQILVSNAFFEVMTRSCEEATAMFRYLGPFQDKHGRIHELHAVTTTRCRASDLKCHEDSLAYGRRADAAGTALDDAQAQALEAELTQHIGPLARSLVARARRQASSMQRMRFLLAPAIADAQARERFLDGQAASDDAGAGAGAASSSSRPPTVGELPLNEVAPRRRAPAGLTPITSIIPSGVPGVDAIAPIPSHGRSATTGAMRRRLEELSRRELRLLETLLGQYIGPMARVLLAREQDAGHHGRRELIEGLAAHIDEAAQRERFRRAALSSLRAENN